MPAARRKVGSGSALRRPATGRHTKLNQDRRGPSVAHALLVGAAILSMAALSLLAQSPPPQPPSSEPGAQSAQAQAQPAGGRGGRRGAGPGGQDNTGADFSPKPAIQARTPEEEAKGFLLPAGYRLELVASDPEINNPAVVEWDGNGRMYLVGVSQLHAGCRCNERTRARQPHQPLGEHQGRRQVRQAHGLRRSRDVPADDPRPRRQQRPDQRDAFRRRGSILGHEQRWRRGQEGDFLLRCWRRPRRQRRARAERLSVGSGQLDLQHVQRVPLPLDTARDSSRADGPERRLLGPDRGRRREDVVHQCGWGARPGQLPVPDSVRQPDAGRRLRAGLRRRVACSRDRRYAGRDAARPPTARRTQPLHRDRRRRYRPWRSTALRIFAAISCSPSLWGD